MDESRQEHDRLAQLTALGHRAAAAPVSEQVNAAGRLAVIAAAAAHSRQRPKSLARPILLAALVASAAVGMLVFVLRPKPIAYEIRGGSGFASNYVSATATAPAEVRFSEGSTIDAEPSTRLRVDETLSNGARVLLERGVTRVHVVHRDGSRWLFVAGPFEVRVTGTRFTLAWDPTSEEISVTLHEGSVEVDSPIGASHFRVRSGQRFRASLLDGTTRLENAATPEGKTATLAPSTATPIPIAPAPAPSSAPAVHPSEAISTHTASESAAHESWPALVRQGAFSTVVADARARGVDACIASSSAADLRALADAARYSSQPDLAQRSLLALRERFPKTSNSAAAGFLLGRIAESNGQWSSAEHWYAGYQSEAPGGEFAADALAGRMRSVAAMSGKQAAKPLAQEYLRRYPDGVHAKAAAAILGSD